MDPQRAGDQQEMADLRLFPVLDALDRASVQSGRFGQSLLGHAEVQPSHACAVADGPAGIADPLVVFGRLHDSHAALKIILCPQQFCGIF